jgi:hypothetical protein
MMLFKHIDLKTGKKNLKNRYKQPQFSIFQNLAKKTAVFRISINRGEKPYEHVVPKKPFVI